MTSLGADLSGITRGGGASADRFHAPKDGSPVGPELMKALRRPPTSARSTCA